MSVRSSISAHEYAPPVEFVDAVLSGRPDDLPELECDVSWYQARQR